jgi:hypothetical protein
MFTHDAEYFQSRGAHGNPGREPFSTTEFPRQATEPRHLVQLLWPRDLLGELASIAKLMAESAHAGENADGAYSGGCRKEHKHNVSQMLWNPSGHRFDAIYFRHHSQPARKDQK